MRPGRLQVERVLILTIRTGEQTVPIAVTQEQQALQASLREITGRTMLAAGRVAIGAGPAQAVTEGTERAGFHVACGHAVALLGERGAHPAVRKLLGTETEASQEFLLTRCLSIAGGTTRILLTQVAERVLDQPR
jgi:hypothetical protein